MANYEFFQNKDCEFFPCHKIREQDRQYFNCLFCFCPLFNMRDCGGNYTLLPNGVKDCSNCGIPHYNRDYVIDKLKNE